MFWFIVLVIAVVGFVAWKLRAPLLAKILGQDRARIDRQRRASRAAATSTGRRSAAVLSSTPLTYL